jgi:putative salt-induced outer membrane protein YdiY
MKHTAYTFLAQGAFAAIALACANASASDRLVLPNGEILVGSLVSQNDEAIVFKSDSFGTISLPASSGAKVEPGAPESAEPAAQTPGWVAAQTPPPPPPPVPDPKAQWERSIEAGYSFQARGQNLDSQTAYIRAEIIRKLGNNSIQIYGKYLYGEQDGAQNADKLDAGVNLRYGFSRFMLVRNDFSYSFDRLKELSNQFEDVLGLSFYLIDGEKFKLHIGPGIASQYAEPELGRNGWKFLVNVSQNLFWAISDNVSFVQDSSYLFDPKDWTNYRLRLNCALKCMVSGNVSVNLRYEYEFEAIRPVAEGRSDHRVYTTLGYKF